MTAHILKHIDRTVPVAHHDHRNAQKCDWLDHARLADVLDKTDGGPIVAKQGVLFMLEHRRVDITGVWQSAGLFDGVPAHFSDQALSPLLSGQCASLLRNHDIKTCFRQHDRVVLPMHGIVMSRLHQRNSHAAQISFLSGRTGPSDA